MWSEMRLLGHPFLRTNFGPWQVQDTTQCETLLSVQPVDWTQFASVWSQIKIYMNEKKNKKNNFAG